MQNRLTIVAVPIGTVVDFFDKQSQSATECNVGHRSDFLPICRASEYGIIFLCPVSLTFDFIREHEHRQSEREYHNNNHGDPEPQHKPNYAGIKT